MGRIKGKLHGSIRDEVIEAQKHGEFSGLCDCGCGEETEIAKITRRNRDGSLFSVAGCPKKYVKGHELGHRKGEDAPNFKGIQHKKGYIYSYAPLHPNAVNNYVPEHVLIMEESLGRCLNHYGFNHKDNEIVHHIDGNRSNNLLENLELLAHGEHSRLHRKEDMAKPNFRGFGCHAKGYGKLTRQNVLDILDLYKAGNTLQREIAEKYNVSLGTINSYINGRHKLPTT